MIVKYCDNGVWGYIDNVRQAANKDIDVRKLYEEYNEERYEKEKEAEEKGWPIALDMCEYADGEKLPEEVIISNKAFVKATENQFEWGHDVHSENLIDGKLWEYPAAVIILYVEEHKEYDTIALVTNQKAYLMNDKGQTIERLV